MQKNHGVSSKAGHVGYLRCRDKYSYAAKDRCPTPNIRIDYILESLQIKLIEKFKDMAVDNLDDEFIAELLNKSDDKHVLLEAELSNLKKEQEKISNNQRNLYADRLNDIISVEEYLNYNKGFIERINEIEKRITEIEKQLNKKDNTQNHKNVKKALMNFLETKCIDREIIDHLVERIEFGEINKETGNPTLKIYWAWD